MKPTIGVIVTCYNYERFVGAAIDSVLAQTRPADEIIVVDDGSTDRSRAIIAGYGAAVIALLQPNAGHVAARNAGFSVSQADIILFLDADDRLLPGALAAIEDIWRPTTAKVQFELSIIDASGQRLGRRFCHFPPNYDEAAVAASFRTTGTYIWPVTSGNAYARWLIAPLMPMAPPQAQDGMLNTIAPLYGEVATIAEPQGQYRLHGNNVTKKRFSSDLAGCPDFPQRIAIRRAEFAVLAAHAAAKNVALPAGDPLDRELVFVNYRLMAKKAGLVYAGDAADATLRLWRCGAGLVLASGGAINTRCRHLLWLSILAASPRPLARRLIRARFNRAEWIARLRARLRRALGIAGVARA